MYLLCILEKENKIHVIDLTLNNEHLYECKQIVDVHDICDNDIIPLYFLICISNTLIYKWIHIQIVQISGGFYFT